MNQRLKYLFQGLVIFLITLLLFLLSLELFLRVIDYKSINELTELKHEGNKSLLQAHGLKLSENKRLVYELVQNFMIRMNKRLTHLSQGVIVSLVTLLESGAKRVNNPPQEGKSLI